MPRVERRALLELLRQRVQSGSLQFVLEAIPDVGRRRVRIVENQPEHSRQIVVEVWLQGSGRDDDPYRLAVCLAGDEHEDFFCVKPRPRYTEGWIVASEDGDGPRRTVSAHCFRDPEHPCFGEDEAIYETPEEAMREAIRLLLGLTR